MLNKRFGSLLLLAFVLILCTGLFSFAMAEGGQVSGRVFVDKNADGIMNEGERALQNATVTLCKAYPNGETEDITSVKTGKDGLYAFSTAQSDTYAVRFTLPGEYRFTVFGEESAVMPVKGNTGYTLPFTLENDQQITMNAGAVYAKMVAKFNELMANPALLEVPPETVVFEEGLEYDEKGLIKKHKAKIVQPTVSA